MELKKALVIILAIAVVGFIVNSKVQHYQGGEIYEAADQAYNLLRKGFNVTITVETMDGKTVAGELISVRGSTITVFSEGKRLTIGGPSATREDIRARLINVEYRGYVYVYEVPPMEGKAREVFSKLHVNSYSERFSGIIYIEGPVSVVKLGKLKYQADYLSYGSITINHLSSNGAVITTNMVPLSFLEEGLDNMTVYTYGLLYVNSDERNLPLKLVEVRTG